MTFLGYSGKHNSTVVLFEKLMEKFGLLFMSTTGHTELIAS